MFIPSTISELKEIARQEWTADDKFYKKLIYFFELKVPPDYTPTFALSFLFPLMLNPESIMLDEPFAVETTQTQGGGLIVEENGIVLRRITIRGHTGFKPRKLKGSAFTILGKMPPAKRSYDRQLPEMVMDAISGQRHFQYLQDTVFRAYGDLKQDPTTASETKLIFHMPKDDEHWEVVPQNFRLERNSGKPTLYNYSIELLVVGKASACEINLSEDQSMLDQIKDILRQANNACQLISGAIRDLTSVVGEIKGVIANIGTILTSAVDIFNAVTDFVDGVTDLVEMPRKLVQGLVEECENAWAGFEEAMDRLGSALGIGTDLEKLSPDDPLPVEVHSAIVNIATACELLLAHPTIFETPLQQQLRLLKEKQSLADIASADELSAAEAASSPTSLVEIAGKGTSLMPGDSNRAKVSLTDAGSEVPGYTNLQEGVIEQSDTLMSMASKFLGDARKWQELAVVNGLKPPFISGQAASDIEEASDQEALPGALGVGKKISIPGFRKAPEDQPLLPVLGVGPEKSIEQRLLGGDLALSRQPGLQPRYDVAVDVSMGSVDAKKVIGLDCLRQAIELRLAIEKGTDLLYRNVGLEPIVGLNWAPVDKELIRFRVAKSIQEDPRIQGIRRLEMLAEGDDYVEVEVDAAVIGFSQPTVIKSTI